MKCSMLQCFVATRPHGTEGRAGTKCTQDADAATLQWFQRLVGRYEGSQKQLVSTGRAQYDVRS